ncbi:MAG: hypothetical protein KY445_01255, partial [Armatimonadetes bacterium]|nr:hypothetical protein [Armatimonadota bacterium]
MKSFSLFLFLMLTVIAAGSAEAQNPQRAAAGLSDSIDIAQPRSEADHAYASHGKVSRQISGDWVGGHDLRRLARTVSGLGSWVSYRLKVPRGVPLTLEIEELENRAVPSQDAVRAYSLWIDGKRAYFRTAQASSGGPLHFFVPVAPRDRDFLDLKIQNETETPFHLGRIWAFADFPRYFERAGMAVPYHLAPTLHLSFNNREADAQKLRSIKTSFGVHPHARPAWTTWLTYANLSDSEIAQRLDYMLSLAQEFDLPLQLSFDSWWGSTPNGIDGQGGFWSDVEYQQVVYNQTQRRFELSIPNRWGNTPWLSVSHPRLNAFKVARLQTAMRMLQERQQRLRAQGKAGLILAVNLDNEPVYWATGNAGLGNDILLADFGAATVEAARRDKVILDPTNGLDFAERFWLWRNLLGYQELIAGAAANAGREAIIVDATGVHVPAEPLRDNIYTQAFVANAALQFPMQNPAYPLWETGAPASARVGGEWNGDSRREREAVLHQLPLGRTAQVNAESGSRVSEMVGVRPGYALGQRYYALYNYPLDKMDVAASEIRDTTQPFEPLVYERVLREETFVDDGWQNRALEVSGLERGVIGNTTAIALHPTAENKRGWITYRLDGPKGGFQGLNIEVSGRAFVSQAKDPNVFIRVLAGTQKEAASMREFGRIFDSGDINAIHRFDLSPAARGQKAVFVRLELSADQLPESVLSWCSIYQLRFTQPWPASLTQGLAVQEESLERHRQQNLLVSWRRDAELAIARLSSLSTAAAPSALAEARQAFARGEYAAAYRRANEAAHFALPGARYRVLSPGRLAPYPIAVQSNAPLTFTLLDFNRDGASFALETEQNAPVKIEFGELSGGKSYSILAGTQGQGSWTLRPTRANDGPEITRLTADAAGKVIWTAPAPKSREAGQGRVVRGIFRALVSETPPVLSFWREDGRGYERVAIEETTQVLRGEAGQEKIALFNQLQRGDDVSVFYDDAGRATRVVAQTLTFEDVVAEAGPLTPRSMPFVRLRGTENRHVIDLSAPLWVSDIDPPKSTTFRSVPLGTGAPQAGDIVRVRLNPRSGRVFELW